MTPSRSHISSHHRLRVGALLLLIAIASYFGGAHPSAQASIAFVQTNNGVPQGANSSVAVRYNSAQTAGNLNVVVVGWNSSSGSVQSVTDTSGNSYVRAVGPTVRSGFGTQSIYYAANIRAASAGANTVNVVFVSSVTAPDIRIAEYRGLATTSPVDVVAASTGSGTTASSGSVTTTNANDLLVGANMVSSMTTAAGQSFTSRVITNPDGDILEDRIVTTTGSYSASATLENGSWVMQMVAFKGAPAADTTAPSTPTGLTATPASSTQINLGWTASTDNVAVTGYEIDRCQGSGCSSYAQIGTSTSPSFNDTGLTGSTTYRYRVRAVDAAANESGNSSSATATTSAPADTQAPTAPSGLAASAVSTTQINLTWAASTDNVGVTNYLVEQCQGAGCTTFAQVGTSATTSFNRTGLSASTTYVFRVRATDAAGNLGTYSNSATGTTQDPPDTQAPTAPSGLTATAASSTQINLSWTASTDNVGVTNYLVEQCQGAGCTTFTQVGTSTTTSYNRSGLTASTTYVFRVRATDAAANLGAYSTSATGTTQDPPDTQAPTAPASLTATAVSTSEIDLSWTAASDNVGVVNYLIERCQGASCTTFAQVATTAGTLFTDLGLSAAVTYRYRVRAVDAANNFGTYSPIASATTPDTQAPTAPTGLSASGASTTQINLNWTASTDNVGVTNYLVERCTGSTCTTFTQIGTSSTPTYSNTGLTASTTYRYRVRATDAAGNLSAYSGIVNGTTQTPVSLGFVQINYATPQGSASSVNVTYNSAQTLGNLNVVAVGWNSSSGSVSTVTDTLGNTYVRAVGPTVRSGFGTQSIYYAANIKQASSGANTVRVTFAASVNAPDIRIAEYRGVATTSPVDVVAASSGSGTSSSSGSVTTTNANDLLVGANMVSTMTTSAGTSFTSRVITSPDGDIFEDRIVTTTGSYSASANLSSGSWIMQMVAFKASTGASDTTVPTVAVTVPANNATVSGASTTVTATASDPVGNGQSASGVSGVQFLLNGNNLGAEVTTSPYTITWNTTTTPNGTYSLTARAQDGAGNSATSNPITVTVNNVDATAPSTPTGLTATAASDTRINLAWTASTDNVAVAGYRVFRNSAQIATTTQPSYGDTGLTANTTYTYTVAAYDGSNNVSGNSAPASATTLTTDAVDPTVAITAPANGATVSSTVTVSATASDNVGVAGVQFQLDGANLGAEKTAAPYSISWSTTSATNGSHSLTAIARDAAGNTTTSAAIGVTVSNSNVSTKFALNDRVQTSMSAAVKSAAGLGSSSLGTQAMGSRGTIVDGPVAADGYAWWQITYDNAPSGWTQEDYLYEVYQPVYPIKASANNRYLVDQNDRPFMIVGDSPHSLIVNLSVSEADTYMANRASYGINTLWTELVCTPYISHCNSSWSTYDGLQPFISNDLSRPNAAYFARVDAMVAAAANHGIQLMLDTWETGSGMSVLRSNGNTKAFNYGVFLGTRYANSPNIVWISGNDFQSWTDATDNDLIKNIMAGIASVDQNHMQTIQLNYYVSGSHDDPLLQPFINLGEVYSYRPTYAKIYDEYNATPTRPVFMEEANYEFENNTGNDPPTNLVLRKQEYWSILAGAVAGQMYGNQYTVSFENGWQSHLSTPGAQQLEYMLNFFSGFRFHDLVPDQNHTVVTAGYGTFADDGSVTGNDYLTAARLPDGSMVVAYLPTIRTITVDMTKLSGPVTARWYDPSRNTYTEISGGPFANTGTRTFRPTANNGDGNGDWVLVLSVAK